MHERALRCWQFTATAMAAAMMALVGSNAEAAAPKGLGDPGKLTQLRLEPNADGKGVLLRSRDGRQQLFATGVYSSGQLRDQTRTVQFTSEPAGVVQIDQTGYMTPLKDGKTVVKAMASGNVTAELPVEVTGVTVDVPINFPNQIVPIFTKLNCNSGGCHGKASGQNGFKLSLLGFYPSEDHEFLVKEGRGRRVFPPSPAQSLLLTKPVGKSPHGGGKRMDVDSYEYRLIYRWIEQGRTPVQAALIGAREIVGPIIAMTITLAAVYAPIGLLGGLTGTLLPVSVSRIQIRLVVDVRAVYTTWRPSASQQGSMPSNGAFEACPPERRARFHTPIW